MKMSLDELNVNNIDSIRENVEKNSLIIDDIVNSIISPYASSLDKYVSFIKDCLKDGENPPTNE